MFEYWEMYTVEKRTERDILLDEELYRLEEVDFIDYRLKTRSACEVRLAAVDSDRSVLDSPVRTTSYVQSIPRDTVLSEWEPIGHVRGSVSYTDEWDHPYVSMASEDERR